MLERYPPSTLRVALPGVVSRKKQVAPKLLVALAGNAGRRGPSRVN